MGKRVKLSVARRGVIGMLRYSQGIPTVPVAREMNLGNVEKFRRQLTNRPTWSAIFIRAYGLVCSQHPELRRCWVSWPRPCLYEHPFSICSLAVEREWQGERILLMGKIQKPEHSSLAKIQEIIYRLKTEDVWSISPFRVSLRFGRLPSFLQRFMLWLKWDISGKRRVKYMGTFGMSNYGMLGAESLHPIGPQTSVLTLGPLSEEGKLTAKLIYDHRVLDGGFIARALNQLEEVIHTTVLEEMLQMRSVAA